jgi:hypothetical protein
MARPRPCSPRAEKHLLCCFAIDDHQPAHRRRVACASRTSTTRPGRLDTLARLIAVAIVLAGVGIGSAIAASIQTEKSAFRTDLSDAAFILY